MCLFVLYRVSDFRLSGIFVFIRFFGKSSSGHAKFQSLIKDGEKSAGGKNAVLLFSTISLIIGFVLDLIIGDPQGWPHLIRAFGYVIAAMEKLFYPMKNKRFGGFLFAISVLAVCFGIPAVLLYAAWRISPWVYLVLESVLCWQTLAAKSLKTASMDVYGHLKNGDTEKARHSVSMIVGRDTQTLDEAGITRAAVETVAENASDGVGAPMFYSLIGGAALACFYKAANTMDSMVGYKNEKYMDFGRFAAKFDDVLNFLPSRLCALIMICVSGICGFDRKNAALVWCKHRRNHASPNSAQTESVVAGALRVRLAGDARYFGKTLKKPFIGFDCRSIEPEDIVRANRLMYAEAFAQFFLTLLIRGIVYAAI